MAQPSPAPSPQQSGPSQSDDPTLAMLGAALADATLPTDSCISFRDVALAAQREPCATPAYYPQSVPPSYYNAALVKRLELDTLFWIFYYQQGTPQQLFAAAELKKSFWRYHTRFRTWLQRHPRELPTEVTPEYEKGTYLVFDNEQQWASRTRTDFVLEYAQLL